jgi:hypothetical protein
MLSDEQEKKKLLRIKQVAEYFLANGGSIKDIETALDIPKSSIQRYLSDQTAITSLLSESDYKKIESLLLNNKKEGLSRGGRNFALNNDPTRNEIGKFTGSRKK